MSKTRQRSIKTEQIKMREMNISLVGTDADPISPLGFDRFGISGIQKTATGVYVISFRDAFERAPVAYVQTTTPATMAVVDGVTASTVTINTFAMDGTTSTDAVLFVKITGSEFSYDV